MKFELKPLTFGEVLDGSFKIFRGNLGLFLAVAVTFNGPTVLMSAWLRMAQQGVAPGKLPPGFFLWTLLITAVSILLWGTMTAAAVQVIQGEPTSLGKACASMFARFGAVVGGSLQAGIIGVLGLIALIVPGVLYLLGRGLFLPVLFVEGGTAGSSLKRSKQLVGGVRRGRMDRMFGTSLVFGILNWVLIWGFGVLVPASVKTTMVGAIVGLLPQILVAPLFPIALVLIYFDARIRDEGYDLELRAKQAGASVPRAEDVAVAGPA